MIYLPLPPTEIRLKSFWLLISLSVGLILAYPFSLLIAIHWLLWTLMIAIVVATPGVLKPHIALLLYRSHNACVRRFAHYAKGWLVWVCFCVVAVALGKKMRTLDSRSLIEHPSHWCSREAPESKAYDVEKTRMIVTVKPLGFVRNFMQWTVQSGYWWIVLLLPYLALLSVFEKEESAHRVPQNIYTLY